MAILVSSRTFAILWTRLETVSILTFVSSKTICIFWTLIKTDFVINMTIFRVLAATALFTRSNTFLLETFWSMWAMFVKNTGILAHSIYTVEWQRSTGITSMAIETDIISLAHLLEAALFGSFISFSSSNNQISEFQIPNIYNKILLILFFCLIKSRTNSQQRHL